MKGETCRRLSCPLCKRNIGERFTADIDHPETEFGKVTFSCILCGIEVSVTDLVYVHGELRLDGKEKEEAKGRS